MGEEIINFSVPVIELSCLVGNLFAELEPPCDEKQNPEGLMLCGRAKSGRNASLLICRDRCTFIGSREDFNAARNGKCPARRCLYG